eukprot:TRINITY_DN31883_c0_g1_i2.p1 TRINITY_DN31883_c0_g1~~TRINITY_DN31883_c0_g1_i2.p1  ORF type:complete len:314 (-),score=57.00 TRINITY_DN31883_c0_g1_i2:80-1021(-)
MAVAPQPNGKLAAGHRYEGTISVAAYVMTSLLMTSLTKYAASVWKFPGSSFMLLVECVVTAAGLAAVSPGAYKPFSLPILKHLPLVTLSKAANMYLSFMAMRLVSLPVYNVLKRLQPIYAMVQDQLIRGVRTTGWELVGVLLISVGTVVTGLGDLDFDLLGYAMAIVAAGTQSLYLVLARRATDAEEHLTHTDLLFYTAFYNLAIFGPLSAIEAGAIADFLGREGETRNMAIFLVPYVLLGAGLNFTTFWCTAVNSPLATAVAGSLKGVFSTMAGLVFFQARLTSVGWCGLVLSTLGGLVYSLAQAWKKSKKA